MATATKSAPANGVSQTTKKKETAGSYFRRLFEQNPVLLNEDNQQALIQWRSDHGNAPLTKGVKTALVQMKSKLKKGAKAGGRRQAIAAAATPISVGGGVPENLEIKIGDSLTITRSMVQGHKTLRIDLKE